MEFGVGGRVMVVEAEVIVTAFPSDSSQGSLIVRGHPTLLSWKLDGPWEVSPYPITEKGWGYYPLQLQTLRSPDNSEA